MKDIDALISAMSLTEKIAQLMVVGFEGTELTGKLATSFSKERFSGFILFKRNIEAVESAKSLIKGLRALYPKETPPIVAVDEEGGRVSQVGHLVSVPPAASRIGNTRNAKFAFFHARDSGQKLKWFGFNVVFAPVLDVNDEPTNPVIGDRSYGADPDVVSALGIAALEGFADAGIAGTAKHFPGHGSSTVDSHKALPVIRNSSERWYTFEFVPFNAAIESGVRLVMTGHIACPGLTEREELPATFSSHVIQHILREELGFKGVVITDALEMHAATGYMDAGPGPEEALLAGCDLLLYAHGGEAALKAQERLLASVREKKLSETRIDESLLRILSLRKTLL
jgi:beta-N-acetylhexosaminidase